MGARTVPGSGRTDRVEKVILCSGEVGRNRPILVIADRPRSRHDGRVASTKRLRRVVLLAFPGVQPLDVIGPAEVFAGADTLAGGDAYTVEVVAKQPGPISTRGNGYSLVPKMTTARCRGS